MRAITRDFLTERLELADQLRDGMGTMLEPQDLPGRYGWVIKALDRLLQLAQSEAVLGGGWAVWRHGYVGRVTQDVDVVLPADRMSEFLRVAAASGFDVLPRPQGRWPKLLHKETGIQVDIRPEGERRRTPSRAAPTTLPHPSTLGAAGHRLRYITLPALIQLKLAAGWARDKADVVELLRANPDQIAAIRHHLSGIHADYVSALDRLVERAQEQRDE